MDNVTIESPLHAVKPTEFRNIPERFNLAHAVAFFFHDQLAKLVVDLEKTDSLLVDFEISTSEQKTLESLNGEDLWNWLKETDRSDVIYDLTYRQVSAAVISDAASFICESLIACAKGKTAVAYSLLRKPMKENLLLLEWMCGSPEDFLNAFNNDSNESFILDKLPLERRKEIIKTAVEKVDTSIVNEELLWTLRYGKEYPNSMETMWTKATHLVTSVKASMTEAGNLNFVFSGESEINTQWEHYYKNVPILINYYILIAEKVVEKFIEWEPKFRDIQLLLRDIAFSRYAENYYEIEDLDEITLAFEDIKFQCAPCQMEAKCNKNDIDNFWLNGEVFCNHCKNSYSIWDLIEDQ